MAHIQFIDDLVKEYLLYRGFSQTLRTLENDLKYDKDKGFRVDRITDQIMSHIHTYDLQGLREFWSHLDKRLFVRLNPSLNQHVKKLETSIFRLYVIHTIQTNKPDKLNDFFEKMSNDLHTQAEWREWFALPYLKGPEESTTFAMYFTRQWQDTLLVSLTNFLSIIFQNVHLPTIARYEEESTYIKSLQEEMELLKVRLNAALNVTTSTSVPDSEDILCDSLNTSLPTPQPPSHLMDDFYNIAQECTQNSESQARSLKNLFGFGGSGQQQNVTISNNERGRTPAHSTNQTDSCRRTSSQAPPSDRRRGRSSSLAANSSRSLNQEKTSSTKVSGERSQEHQPVKRLAGSRRSRSPSRLEGSSVHHVGSDEFSSGLAAPFCMINEVVIEKETGTVVTCAVLSPNSQMLATGDCNSTVNIYSNLSGNRWQRSTAGVSNNLRGRVAALAWLGENGRVLLSATHQGHIGLWDCRDNRVLWEGGPESMDALKDRRLMCAAVTPSSSSVILSVTHRVKSSHLSSISSPSNNSPGTIRPNAMLLFDVKTKQIETSYNLPSGCSVNSCDINHNGSLVVCGCSDGCLRIIDLRTPDVIASWPGHKGQVFTVKLSHHQDKIYTIGSDNKLCCWSLTQTGGKLLEQNLHKQAAGPFMVNMESGPDVRESNRSVLLRPYGSLFALHDNDKHIFTCSSSGSKVYEVNGNRLSPVQEFGNHRQPAITLDWNMTERSNSQDGLCVTASLDGSVTLTSLVGHKISTTS